MFRWLKNFKLPRPTGQGLRTAALFMGAPIFGGILIWQLRDLTPEAIGAICRTFKFSETSCLTLHTQIYGIKDNAITGLMVILGLGYLMMMMRELRLQGSATGPLGIGFNLSDADKEPPKPLVTTTTVVNQPGAPLPTAEEKGE